MKKKAIALVSGGLDSLLAAKVIMEQGIPVEGVVFLMQFASRDIREFTERVRQSANEANIPIKFIDMSEEFLGVLRSPDHGYGANLNPCIDCKILMLKLAKDIMKKENAGFVITGEVLGERPMSQRKGALDIIRKRSSLDGYLLRPLSAKLLEKTVPEAEGVVDRSRLLDLSGRGRSKQLALAKKYSLTKFFAPSGGCLLTDKIFARKLKDLIDSDALDPHNIALLKWGRHFRLDKATKTIVGRDEKDNMGILELKHRKDVLLRLKDDPGPYVLLRGNVSFKNIKKAADLLLAHSKSKRKSDAIVEYWTKEENKKELKPCAMDREKIDRLRI
ncbi:MAG: tRNA 4-thiouridine(8) synthase ThiI [Candidatus Omnitrophica bacterium]|nr:tRNA 4-thiouridine(8) synthase ThiI [Candidatus Omnitrophota bacterium]